MPKHATLGIDGKVPASQLPAGQGAPAWADITGKPTELLPEAHGHPYEPADAAIQSHIGSSHAPADAQKNSDITKSEIEAKLTGEVTSHTHPASGGADPWTYVRLASDFPTTSNSAQDVTGMNFTPAADKRYEIEGKFLLRTATATVGPRPGCAWATGLSDGVATFWTTSSASAQVMANGNINAAVLGPVGGLPNATQSWPAYMEGMLVAGASPSGVFKIQLASETNGTQVTMKAGSFLKYREIP